MRLKLFVFVAATGLLWALPAAAADPGCEKGKTCTMACCQNHQDGDAIAVLMGMDRTPAAQDMIPTPVRQTLVVNFRNPVQIGDRILMGRYVIEHDNDRMAHGRPCTHIYDINNRQVPIVSFYCVHLTRPTVASATVTLNARPDLPAKLTEFQFGGDTAAHGVPGVR